MELESEIRRVNDLINDFPWRGEVATDNDFTQLFRFKDLKKLIFLELIAIQIEIKKVKNEKSQLDS